MNADGVAQMRAALFRMVVGVIVVDAIALSVWLLTDVSQSERWRWPMLTLWLVLTLAVVLPGLRAIRIARRG